MIQLLSRLQVADNTGAKQVRMIRRIGQLKKTASVGDIIVCHVKESSVEAKKGVLFGLLWFELKHLCAVETVATFALMRMLA